MKRLLLILILTLSFQTLAKTDDIRDFEIEGISVGDSLLDYFNKTKIDNNKYKPWKDKKTYRNVFITLAVIAAGTGFLFLIDS